MKFAKNLAQICNIQSKTFLVSRISTCLTWSALAGSNAVAETSQCATTAVFFHIIPWRTKWENWGTRTPGKYGGGLSLLGGGPKRGTSVVSWLSWRRTAGKSKWYLVPLPTWTTCDLRSDTFTMAMFNGKEMFAMVEIGGLKMVGARGKCCSVAVHFLLKKLISQVCVVTVMLFIASHCQCKNGENGRMRKQIQKMNPLVCANMCKSSPKCENVKGNCHCQKHVGIFCCQMHLAVPSQRGLKEGSEVEVVKCPSGATSASASSNSILKIWIFWLSCSKIRSFCCHSCVQFVVEFCIQVTLNAWTACAAFMSPS